MGRHHDGDEAYAGSRNFVELERAVRDIWLPACDAHPPGARGRADPLPELVKRCQGKAPVFISNYHFDTTKAHVELAGARAINLLTRKALDTTAPYAWKGILISSPDRHHRDPGADNVAGIIITVTCNSAGGQPVSMANMEAVSELARRHHIPVVIDAARFAENAWFIKERDPAYAKCSIKEIVHQMFALGTSSPCRPRRTGWSISAGSAALKRISTCSARCRCAAWRWRGLSPTVASPAGTWRRSPSACARDG
ncbi:hypothetical protein H2136_22195 [Aeromonas hydrophila]|uniref:Aromatic amino acid beta-eliminating lyase/threonine aldolase domain-containing protein n=1 Tax=Aeromonas hydrophila TaxID=644 RepID=A0A926IYU0_AERHY|nr:hypothetical protein [Aeromonas hydrophila]